MFSKKNSAEDVVLLLALDFQRYGLIMTYKVFARRNNMAEDSSYDWPQSSLVLIFLMKYNCLIFRACGTIVLELY